MVVKLSEGFLTCIIPKILAKVTVPTANLSHVYRLFYTIHLPCKNGFMDHQTFSFDNTRIAFANKSDQELKDAHWLFGIMNKPWLVNVGTRMAPWSIRAGLPVKGIIRNTIFRQFVGGETLSETAPVAQKLAASNVKIILDYGVEGKEGEKSFDNATEQFIKVIRYAASQPNIPYMSVKVTGIARF